MNLQTCFYNSAIMAGRPPTEDAPPFGRRLSVLRKSWGWSQRALASSLETTREIIDYYERRTVNPSLAFIERTANQRRSVAGPAVRPNWPGAWSRSGCCPAESRSLSSDFTIPSWKRPAEPEPNSRGMK
jgi:DNA-binding XRE family transcriptional regulator